MPKAKKVLVRPQAKKKGGRPPKPLRMPGDDEGVAHTGRSYNSDGLNSRQALFVQEYLVDLNGTQAAIRAGYSPDSAAMIGSDNLRKPNIARAIGKAQQARLNRAELTGDMVIAELRKLGFANMQDYMSSTPEGDPFLDFSALSRDEAAALQEVTVEDYREGRGDGAREVKRVKFRLADKRAALVDLGKHLKLFVERHEVTGPNGGPIQHEDVRGRNLDAIAALSARQSGAAPGEVAEGEAAGADVGDDGGGSE